MRSVNTSKTWKVVKPLFNDVLARALFPVLCHSEEDQELWEDDQQEYIREKLGVYRTCRVRVEFGDWSFKARHFVDRSIASVRLGVESFPTHVFCSSEQVLLLKSVSILITSFVIPYFQCC